MARRPKTLALAFPVAVLLGASLASTALAVLDATPASADSCPNAQFRTGYSGYLPDCRAYELVSPPGAEPYITSNPPETVATQASVDGERLGWFSLFVPPDISSSGDYYLSNRAAAGWSTEGMVPPQSTNDANFCLPTMVFYSSDLSKGLLADGPHQGQVGTCGSDEPVLVPGEPQGYLNLFVRDNATGAYQLVNVTPAGVAPNFAFPKAGSPDLSHVVFAEDAPLTPDAPAAANISSNPDYPSDLYEWANGAVRLLSYLPDGTPVRGEFPDQLQQSSAPGGNYRNALSADGSRVVFSASGSLYLRERAMAPQSPVSGGVCTNPVDACTVQLDAPRGGSGPGGSGQFMWASTDGSEVYFTDDASAGLTADTVPGSGSNLYRYDAATGALTDVTPVGDAEVGGVLGAANDVSYLYFEALGSLAPGATAEQPNLYLYHGGETTFIATLATGPAFIAAPTDGCDWSCLTARVSPDGRFLAFNSIQSLTGYDNVPADPSACDLNGVLPSGTPCMEVYLYDAASPSLSCASCDPSGAPPTGATWIRAPKNTLELNLFGPGTVQRNLSDSGRVFFDSPNALVPGDTNGTQDVYEYENGQPHLLTSGRAAEASYFLDASPSGDDVFIRTAQQLLAQDTNAGPSVYDARIDGGMPEPPPAVLCETEEACHGRQQQPPAASSPGTAHFEGPEEGPHHPRCRKGQVKRHGGCVSKKHRKRHRRSHRRAGHDRGGQK